MKELKINKAYAEKYDEWRQKEELQKLKDKYGNISDLDTDSSSSESEDENAEGLTAAVERDWLKTYAALKSRDPKIYNKEEKFYQSGEESESSEETAPKKKKEKPIFLKDYERNVILEKGGILSDESGSDEEDVPQKPSYVEEQEEIRKSFKTAFADSDEDSSDSEFLTKKQKSKEDKAKEEDDYENWLKKEKKGKKKEKQFGVEIDSLKQYWNNPELDEGEKFLRDYILKQQYLDKDADRIPTYEEIVDDGDGISEDEEALDNQEEFERKYNFRFEEPDQDFIKSFPRQIDDTVRRKESRRAEKRKEMKERKKKEKDKRKQEIKQLKNLKKKEIMNKIEKLKEVTGNKALGLKMEDIEDDFDPDKHDEMMKACFDKDYYGEDEEGDTKPVFSDDEDLIPENWDNWTGEVATEEGDVPGDEAAEEGDEPHVDDANFVMDADYDPTQVVEKSSKKKKKSKFKQALAKKKPVFDPEKKSFEEYVDEYYSLDYEDIVDDKPCRFRYRTVVPNDFGLSVNEILSARDKELNAWVSLKKMSQYRTEEEEKDDVNIYVQKSKNVEKKGRILTSLTEKQEKGETGSPNKKKRRKKKKKTNEDTKSSESVINSAEEAMSEDKETEVESSPVKNTKKRKLQQEKQGNVSAKKKKKMIRNSTENSGITSVTKEESDENKTGQKGAEITSNKQSKNKQNKKTKGKLKQKDESEINPDVTNQVGETTPQKKKAKKRKLLASEVAIETSKGENSEAKQTNDGVQLDSNTGPVVNQTKTKKKKKKKKNKNTLPKLSDERLLAYGINPKKLKFMKTDNYKQSMKE